MSLVGSFNSSKKETQELYRTNKVKNSAVLACDMCYQYVCHKSVSVCMHIICERSFWDIQKHPPSSTCEFKKEKIENLLQITIVYCIHAFSIWGTGGFHWELANLHVTPGDEISAGP